MAAIPPQNTSRPMLPQHLWKTKYRGATVQDLDLPPALSLTPTTPISTALLTAFERDYTHLTIVTPSRSLLGYIHIPTLHSLLTSGKVAETDPVSTAMMKFARSKDAAPYQVIHPGTELEELEAFFEKKRGGKGQEFAVVTDAQRKFVLGVVTLGDLGEFASRRA